jgi:hypothetical protein
MNRFFWCADANHAESIGAHHKLFHHAILDDRQIADSSDALTNDSFKQRTAQPQPLETTGALGETAASEVPARAAEHISPYGASGQQVFAQSWKQSIHHLPTAEKQGMCVWSRRHTLSPETPAGPPR